MYMYINALYIYILYGTRRAIIIIFIIYYNYYYNRRRRYRISIENRDVSTIGQ